MLYFDALRILVYKTNEQTKESHAYERDFIQLITYAQVINIASWSTSKYCFIALLHSHSTDRIVPSVTIYNFY